MARGDLEITRVEIDRQADSAWRTWKAENGKLTGRLDSQLLELVPDRRLGVPLGVSQGPLRRQESSYESQLVVNIEEEGHTLLTLEHEQLDELAAAMPHVASAVRRGWRTCSARRRSSWQPAGTRTSSERS
jgi:hypothetical protein